MFKEALAENQFKRNFEGWVIFTGQIPTYENEFK